MTVVLNPLQDGPVVVVSAVGEAEGSRGAAAALACASADLDTATLLVDVGGKPPRPALLASAAAQALEERLAAHLPDVRVAARGQVCHLAVSADPDGMKVTAAAVAVVRGATAALHVPPELLQEVVETEEGPRPSGVLLRADLDRDRPLVALVVRDLLGRGIPTAVLKRRLQWVAERRAHFGALPPGGSGGLPKRLVRQLTPAGP